MFKVISLNRKPSLSHGRSTMRPTALAAVCGSVGVLLRRLWAFRFQMLNARSPRGLHQSQGRLSLLTQRLTGTHSPQPLLQPHALEHME